MVENNQVLIKKLSIKTQSKKLYITINCTQENFKWHIQQEDSEDSWLK